MYVSIILLTQCLRLRIFQISASTYKLLTPSYPNQPVNTDQFSIITSHWQDFRAIHTQWIKIRGKQTGFQSVCILTGDKSAAELMAF